MLMHFKTMELFNLILEIDKMLLSKKIDKDKKIEINIFLEKIYVELEKIKEVEDAKSRSK